MQKKMIKEQKTGRSITIKLRTEAPGFYLYNNNYYMYYSNGGDSVQE